MSDFDDGRNAARNGREAPRTPDGRAGHAAEQSKMDAEFAERWGPKPPKFENFGSGSGSGSGPNKGVGIGSLIIGVGLLLAFLGREPSSGSAPPPPRQMTPAAETRVPEAPVPAPPTASPSPPATEVMPVTADAAPVAPQTLTEGQAESTAAKRPEEAASVDQASSASAATTAQEVDPASPSNPATVVAPSPQATPQVAVAAPVDRSRVLATLATDLDGLGIPGSNLLLSGRLSSPSQARHVVRHGRGETVHILTAAMTDDGVVRAIVCASSQGRLEAFFHATTGQSPDGSYRTAFTRTVPHSGWLRGADFTQTYGKYRSCQNALQALNADLNNPGELEMLNRATMR